MTTPTVLTAEQIRTMPTAELTALLRDAAQHADDQARRGALHVLTGYNDGTLLALPVVRGFIEPTDDGPLFRWTQLGQAVGNLRDGAQLDAIDRTDPRHALARINTTALDALLFAVSLAAGTPVPLRGMCSRSGRVNRLTLLEGLAMALGVTGPHTFPERNR